VLVALPTYDPTFEHENVTRCGFFGRQFCYVIEVPLNDKGNIVCMKLERHKNKETKLDNSTNNNYTL
jgi:hypothetical protein